jgi:hypothetical protein
MPNQFPGIVSLSRYVFGGSTELYGPLGSDGAAADGTPRNGADFASP